MTPALELSLLRAAYFHPNSTAGFVAKKYLKADEPLEAMKLRLNEKGSVFGFWGLAEPQIIATILNATGHRDDLPKVWRECLQ